MTSFDPTPENCQRLTQVFEHCAQNPQDSAQCLEQLEQYESLPGFWYSLSLVLSNASISSNSRVYAAAFLKNRLAEWWKRPVQAASVQTQNTDGKEEERRAIRAHMLQLLFVEQDTHVVSLVANMVSIISSYDFPLYWPEFGQSLFQHLETTVQPIHTPTGQISGFQLNSSSGKTQDQLLSTASRIFDTLNLTLIAITSRPALSEAIRDRLILPYLQVSYQLWVLYSDILNQALSQLSTHISSQPYLHSIKILLHLVEQVTIFISKAVSSQPDAIVKIGEGALADQIFQFFGKCISSFQSQIQALPSHAVSIVIRNHLNTIRGHCSQCISGCISHSPVLFRKYLEPYTTLFINIIKARAIEKTNEYQLLAVQHACEEVGIGWDNEDQSDLSLRGQDPCIINAFQFLTQIISNKNYRRIDDSSAKTSQSNALLSLQVNQHGLQSVQEASQLAIQLMSDEWTLGLADLIIKNFLIYNRYEVQQICNSAESFFFSERELTADNSEKQAAMECLQKLHWRTPTLIIDHINQQLTAVAPHFSTFIDYPFGQPPPNVSKSELILQSWYVDSVIMAVVALVNGNPELIYDIDFPRLRDMFVDYYKQFTQKALAAGPQQQQAGAMVVGEGIIDKIVFEQCPTTMHRLLVTFKLTEHIPQYINNIQVYELWLASLPLALVDNFFIKLTVSNVIRNFADNLAVTDDTQPQSDQECQYSTITLQQSITMLIKHCVMLAQDVEPKHDLLFTVKTCLATKQLSALIQLLPLILPVLAELWADHLDETSIAGQIIGIIERLVSGLGPLCYLIVDPVVAILADVIQLDSPLFDPALLLWQILLENVPFLTKPLLDLFPRWLEAFSEYPEMYTELGWQILRHYLLASAFNNTGIPELKVDIEYLMTQQIPLIHTQLPASIQALIKSPPQPHPQTVFDLYGDQLLNCFGILFGNLPSDSETASALFDPFDIVLRCIDPAQLFAIPAFTNILQQLASKVFPSVMFEILTNGLSSRLPSTSQLNIRPQSNRQVIQQISTQLCGLPTFPEIDQEFISYAICLFSRLAIQCPQHFIQFFSQITVPTLGPETPLLLQNALNLYFAAALHYCHEDTMRQLFQRKQFVLGLLQGWAMYQYCGQQLTTLTPQQQAVKVVYQQFIALFDQPEFIYWLWVVILTECVEDEVPENRYQIVQLQPINLSDVHFQREPCAFATRRATIITNHDITATTRVNDIVYRTLNLVIDIKGRDYIAQLLASLPLELTLHIDLRR